MRVSKVEALLRGTNIEVGEPTLVKGLRMKGYSQLHSEGLLLKGCQLGDSGVLGLLV